mmetsp:Transcript_23684/g.32613  ORF Transcript_23684/g.32613 Transcript_23684/m.32613 type:complete len:242 (-) Transcript_23684:200-925(-)
MLPSAGAQGVPPALQLLLLPLKQIQSIFVALFLHFLALLFFPDRIHRGQHHAQLVGFPVPLVHLGSQRPVRATVERGRPECDLGLELGLRLDQPRVAHVEVALVAIRVLLRNVQHLVPDDKLLAAIAPLHKPGIGLFNQITTRRSCPSPPDGVVDDVHRGVPLVVNECFFTPHVRDWVESFRLYCQDVGQFELLDFNVRARGRKQRSLHVQRRAVILLFGFSGMVNASFLIHSFIVTSFSF